MVLSQNIMAVETLQLQFESLICKQNLAQLVDTCNYLKIEESVEDKTALQIVKIIQHFVEDVVATPGDRDIEVFLGDAVAYVTGSAPPLEKSEDENFTSQNSYNRPIGCRNCRAEGSGSTCNHCFHCGSSSHFRAQCPNRSNQGNKERLFQGGQE